MEPLCTDRPPGLSRSTKAPLLVRYDLDAAAAAMKAVDTQGGLWRYAPLLPVWDPPAAYAADVGSTAHRKLLALGDELHVDLWIKCEGSNPTGSFKDRGLAMGVALGVACGAKRFCLPTQGNAGVAAAFFSRRLGLPGALIYMPEGYQRSGYYRSCAHFGAEVRFFGDNIAAAGKEMRRENHTALESGELVDMSTFFEPGRLEGKKTMGFEIAAAFSTVGLPDHIFYPTGGGTGLVGIWKAFAELVALGMIDRANLPKMVAVQSAQCAPVVAAFERAADAVTPITSQGTVADGLDVPGAIMGHQILSTLRESHGTAVAVSEASINAAFAQYGRQGVAASYEGAATLAALTQMRELDEVAPGSKVLLLNTASHLIALAG